jgi:hypothetical protein
LRLSKRNRKNQFGWSQAIQKKQEPPINRDKNTVNRKNSRLLSNADWDRIVIRAIGHMISDWWIIYRANVFHRRVIRIRYGASLGGPLCDAYSPTLELFSCTCLHTASDDDQTRPKYTTQRPNKHHHYGGGATNPSGGVDLMNPHRLRGGQPCTWLFQGCYWSNLIDSIN